MHSSLFRKVQPVPSYQQENKIEKAAEQKNSTEKEKRSTSLFLFQTSAIVCLTKSLTQARRDVPKS